MKNGLCKIVTKSQVVTKFNVTKSRLHCIMYDLVKSGNEIGKFPYSAISI